MPKIQEFPAAKGEKGWDGGVRGNGVMQDLIPGRGRGWSCSDLSWGLVSREQNGLGEHLEGDWSWGVPAELKLMQMRARAKRREMWVWRAVLAGPGLRWRVADAGPRCYSKRNFYLFPTSSCQVAFTSPLHQTGTCGSINPSLNELVELQSSLEKGV